MARRDSTTPYLATAALLLGLAVLIVGVDQHSYTIQGTGGAILVAGIFWLAWFLDRLPDATH